MSIADICGCQLVRTAALVLVLWMGRCRTQHVQDLSPVAKLEVIGEELSMANQSNWTTLYPLRPDEVQVCLNFMEIDPTEVLGVTEKSGAG